MKKIFLSHSHDDKATADTLARLIDRLTLGQLSLWRSSDPDPAGGVRPGSVWLDEIRQELSSCRAILALLTRNSIRRPWILFESGFGAAQETCEVIPVCVGLAAASEVPFPLAMYQVFLLGDYDSLRRFCEKLFAKYDIRFDLEMTEPLLRDAAAIGSPLCSNTPAIEVESGLVHSTKVCRRKVEDGSTIS